VREGILLEVCGKLTGTFVAGVGAEEGAEGAVVAVLEVGEGGCQGCGGRRWRRWRRGRGGCPGDSKEEGRVKRVFWLLVFVLG